MAVISLTSLQRYSYATVAVAALALGAVGGEPAEAERAKADFQVNYGAALDAIAKDDWPGAQVLLESALTKLGKHEHPDKAKAKAILVKAQRTNAQRREMETALQTAQELLRQQQWVDAIAMFKKAKELGAKRALPLPVSVPSHCSLMRDAAAELARELENIAIELPRLEVIHNHGASSADSVEEIRNRLELQLYSPVEWVASVQQMGRQGIDTLIECGPGKVLTGLTRRIDKSMQAFAVYDADSLEQTRQTIGES